MSEWITVKERLPNFGYSYKYLFINGKGEVTYGYAYPKEEGWDTGDCESIWINDMDRESNEIATFWMPLPNPPKDEV